MLELTFNFHGALSILIFSENELTIFTKKNKEKKERRKKMKKKEIKWGEKKRKKKRKKRKTFFWAHMSEKSILCGVNLKILISKFSSYESWKIVGQKTRKRADQ